MEDEGDGEDAIEDRVGRGRGGGRDHRDESGREETLKGPVVGSVGFVLCWGDICGSRMRWACLAMVRDAMKVPCSCFKRCGDWSGQAPGKATHWRREGGSIVDRSLDVGCKCGGTKRGQDRTGGAAFQSISSLLCWSSEITSSPVSDVVDLALVHSRPWFEAATALALCDGRAARTLAVWKKSASEQQRRRRWWWWQCQRQHCCLVCGAEGVSSAPLPARPIWALSDWPVTGLTRALSLSHTYRSHTLTSAEGSLLRA